MTAFMPARVPFLDERTGLISREWQRFLNERLGGEEGDSTTSISERITRIEDASRLGIFDKRPQREKTLTGSEYIAVTRNAGGYTFTLNMDGVVDQVRASIVPYLPRLQAAIRRPDDAQAVIASQVFGVR